MRAGPCVAAPVEEVVGRATPVEAVVGRRKPVVCAAASEVRAKAVVVEARPTGLVAPATPAVGLVVFVGPAVKAEYPDLFVVDEANRLKPREVAGAVGPMLA